MLPSSQPASYKALPMLFKCDDERFPFATDSYSTARSPQQKSQKTENWGRKLLR